MKIGNARFCLSPKKEFYLIGFRSDNRNYPASGIHDDIYCNSLLFEDEGKKVFIFSADFLEFEEEMAEEVKTLLNERFGIERDLVLLCATHDHSSIVSYHKGWYTNKFDKEYYDFLIDSIIKSYEECQKNLQDAYVRYGKQKVFGYYGNRNHPGQPADNEVIVVKFYNKDNKAFAGIVNWAVHSTVISAENTYLSSDLAGEVSKKLYKSFGFYPAMLVGAAGDCSNRNEREGNGFEELERVSSALAEIIGNIKDDTEVKCKDIDYTTFYHTVHHNMEFVHENIKKEISKLEDKMNNEQDSKKKEMLATRIHNMSQDLKINKFHLDIKAEVISLGEIQLFVFPGELGSKFGIEMKNQYKGLGLILGYTNGYNEYFMPEEEYGLSFETIGSRIPKGEPEKIVNKFIKYSQYLI